MMASRALFVFIACAFVIILGADVAGQTPPAAVPAVTAAAAGEEAGDEDDEDDIEMIID